MANDQSKDNELELDLVKCIQIDALWCVQKDLLDEPDSDYTLRTIQRWFSKNFFMALPAVEELPLPYVLQHYYESHFEEMNEWDFRQTVRKTISTRAELAQMAAEEEEELDAERRFLEEAREEAAQEGPSKEILRIQEQLAKFKDTMGMLGGEVKKAKPKPAIVEEPSDVQLIGDELGDLPEIEGPDDLLDGSAPLSYKAPPGTPHKW